ncbi:MAG: hypothetical protein EAZ07_00700 [Cytophagales bacterium]|nr:MAG: hypothetical protein EAZ07_00700 [Cytophagales bacterium]
METLLDLLKIILPAALVLYGMYVTINSFLAKEFEKRVVELKLKNTDIILPIRLQAYERMCLFLERISPHNLVIRINEPGIDVSQFHQKLLTEIRNEYNHNLSQQVYMTDNSWNLIKKAMEDVMSIINSAALDVPKDARSIELAKMVFENLMQRNQDPISPALKFIKEEIRVVF